MANAEDLRRFATAQFRKRRDIFVANDREYRWWEVHTLIPDDEFLLRIESILTSVGYFVEREGWHTLGARLGHFEAPRALDPVERSLIRRALQSDEASLWPRWFRSFAGLLLEDTKPGDLWHSITEVTEETVAVFQAATVLSDELYDPLILSLQWHLQSRESALDESFKTDPATVYTQFEIYGDNSRDAMNARRPPARCIAGLLKLIEVMAAFDNLFTLSDECPSSEAECESESQESPHSPQHTPRLSIARATANLVTWRLNLRDVHTVRRLAVVVNAFWDVCDDQLDELPREVTWDRGGSYEALVAMLERWRDRADPDTDHDIVDLDPLRRYVVRQSKKDAAR